MIRLHYPQLIVLIRSEDLILWVWHPTTQSLICFLTVASKQALGWTLQAKAPRSTIHVRDLEHLIIAAERNLLWWWAQLVLEQWRLTRISVSS